MIVDIMTQNVNDKFAPYQRMANAIIAVTEKHGGCMPHDLIPCGFSKQEITDLWDMARAMADVELKLMENHSMANFRWIKDHVQN